MKAPFPWFGGKSKASEAIWQRFGDVDNYVEPFAGSLAVLLSRPHYPFTGRNRVETVNDKDAYIANFWRAVAADPDAVAAHADYPVNECDLHARHQWLHGQAERIERTKSDPDFYDVRVAGYWAWGLSSWIGDNFCRPEKCASIPHLGDNGQGVNRKLPESEFEGGVCETRRAQLCAYFRELQDRLRFVRVCCGDWARVLTPSVTFKHGMTGILLDPPYDIDGCTGYGEDHAGLSSSAREWAIANASPLMRIALCGYKDEGHEMPQEWEEIEWKNGGGYNNLGDKKNLGRERIWFSPACLKSEQYTLF